MRDMLTYLECSKCGHVTYGVSNNSHDDKDTIIAQRESEIEKLKSEIDNLKQESEVMVESFRISSDMLLERLKDLESVNFAGERPQTAQVLGRIHGTGPNDLKRPAIMDDMGDGSDVQVLNLEEDDEEESKEEYSEDNRCPNCKDMFRQSEFAKHTIQ
jgi:hypothetical protein